MAFAGTNSPCMLIIQPKWVSKSSGAETDRFPCSILHHKIMTKKIALFPGSFDPFTIGHQNIILRAIPLFDEIVIGIGYNSEKSNSFFSLEQRTKWIENVFNEYPQVSVKAYQGLTVDFCKEIGAKFILRGVRNSNDYEFEKSIAQMNTQIAEGIETIILFTAPEHSAVTSTIVRDIFRHGGNASQFVPDQINLNTAE